MRLASMRINLMWVGLAMAAILIAFFVFAGRGSPTATANDYIEALGRGDVAKLTELTYVRSGDRDAMMKGYEFSTQEAGKNYSFLWRVKDEHQADANTA